MAWLRPGIHGCPVCAGPLARWTVHPRFTCHHCHWALSSNLTSVRRWALGAALATEGLLFAAIWLVQQAFWSATGIYLLVACLPGALAWWLVSDLAVRLTPLHPPARHEA